MKTNILFELKDEESKLKLMEILENCKLELGKTNICVNSQFNHENIHHELTRINETIDKLQEYKEILYNSVIFYW